MEKINNEKHRPINTDSMTRSLRADIDRIVEKILEMINRRLSLAGDIGRIKTRNGGQVVDGARESSLFKRLLGSYPMADAECRDVYS